MNSVQESDILMRLNLTNILSGCVCLLVGILAWFGQRLVHDIDVGMSENRIRIERIGELFNTRLEGIEREMAVIKFRLAPAFLEDYVPPKSEQEES